MGGLVKSSMSQSDGVRLIIGLGFLRTLSWVLVWSLIWSLSWAQIANAAEIDIGGETPEKLHLSFSLEEGHYGILYRGEAVAEITQPVAILETSDSQSGEVSFTDQNTASTVFYLVRAISIAEPGDWDGDGIDDLFEWRRLGLDPFDGGDAMGDADGDGLTNRIEYLQGTDPNVPGVYTVTLNGAGVVVGRPGTPFVLEGAIHGFQQPLVGIRLTAYARSLDGDVTENVLVSDHEGRFRLPLRFGQGTIEVSVTGPALVNQGRVYLANHRLRLEGEPVVSYFAGEPVVLDLRLEGDPSWPLDEGLEFQLDDGVVRWNERVSVDPDGQVSVSWNVRPGRSEFRLSSEQLPGQVISVMVSGLVGEAAALEVLRDGEDGSIWLPQGAPSRFRLHALSDVGTSVPGAPVEIEMVAGRAEVVLERGFTDRSGESLFTVTPDEPGLIAFDARSGGRTVRYEYAVEPLTYEKQLRPVMQKCTVCHDAFHSLPLMTFEDIRHGIGPRSRRPIIDEDRPEESSLVFLTDPDGGEMFLNAQCCQLGEVFSRDDARLIRDWVLGGAREAFIRPGQPELILANGGLDQVGVPGTTLPKALRLVALDSLGLPVPLVRFQVQSNQDSDTVITSAQKTGYQGEISVRWQLGEMGEPRQLAVMAPDYGLQGRFELAVNGRYETGDLGTSDHPFDQALFGILKPRNLEPTARSSRSEFLTRVVGDTLGRHPDPNDAEIGEAIRDYLAAEDGKTSRARLIQELVASDRFLQHWVSERLSTWIEMPPKGDPRDGEPRFDEPVIHFLKEDDSMQSLVKFIGPLGGRSDSWKAVDFSEAGFAVASTHDLMEGGKNSFEQMMSAFAGASIGCARCHDHKLTGPRDDPAWTQAQAYDMYAFFAQNQAALAMPQGDGSLAKSAITNPVWWADGEAFKETSLESIDPWNPIVSLASRRNEFWDRLTTSPLFSRAVGHRIWSELVAPMVDPTDIREGTLEPLRESGLIGFLEVLSHEFERVNGSLGEFVALCLESEVYQRSSRAEPGYDGRADAYLGRFPVRRRFAEVLDHGFHSATGTPFVGHDSVVLKVLGYPVRRVVPHWDHRRHTGGVTEALMLLNSRTGTGWKAAQSDAALLVSLRERLRSTPAEALPTTFSELAKELFRAALLRDPGPRETAVIDRLPANEQSLVDIAAALGACSEFVFR